MSMRRALRRRDAGAVVVQVALSIVVLMVMAGFAIDLGIAFNERRQDQSAADSGVLGGAMRAPESLTALSEEAGRVVRANLETSYTDAEWAALWGNCVDPDHKILHGTVLGVDTECISFDPIGIARVQVPDQVLETNFVQVVGIDTISVGASAEATISVPGIGGVLPFAVLFSAPNGGQLCLRSSAGGQASPPCNGPESGNFGALESPQYGNVSMGTEDLPCNLTKLDQLAVNISIGIDHFIRTHEGTDILDTCGKPYGPTMLNTFQGISGGLWEGMVAGGDINGVTIEGRLGRGDNPKRQLSQAATNFPIDNTPLWEYIPNGKAGTVPATCTRESFTATVAAGGGVAGNAQMDWCLVDYAAGSGYAPLFDLDADDDDVYDILGSPRFGFVPQFQESGFPSGNGYLRISGFRAVFIQRLYFGCTGGGQCPTIVGPGEGTTSVPIPNGSAPLDQITGYLLPFPTLPTEVFEHGPGGSLGVMEVRLSG